MNKTREVNERRAASLWQMMALPELSRREFLALSGRVGAASVLAAYTPMVLLPSAAQAEAKPAKPTDELIYLSATALAKAIRAKEVSSEEVVNAYLRRIEAVNPKLNAVVQLTTEAARAQAREADAALARGEIKGPLHGVPFTVKDTIETAGVICAAGTKGRASFVPTQDATTVARLRAAGAILLGKTNTSELGLGFETDNLVYGRTNNPYNLSCTPGGSSGGDAAIIAAGGSPLGLGSSSISIPAHCCGIASLAPTPVRVPRTGHFPPPLGPGADVFQVGLMARFVEDLSLTLPLIAGVDERDPAIVSMPFDDPRAVALKSLRVAFYTDNRIVSPTPETVAAVRTAAKALSDVGTAVEEARPTGIEQTYELFTMAFIVSASLEGSATRHWGQRLLEIAGTTEAETHPLTQRLLKAQRTTAVRRGNDHPLPVFKWSGFRSNILAFLEKYDVVVCPVSASPALPHGTTWDDDKLPTFSYAMTYSLTGMPVVVVRGGTSPEGLPIGVQVVARPWREDRALAVAQHIETALGGWHRPTL